jgi:hypothetical protein
MKYFRLFADSEGESHCELVDPDMHSPEASWSKVEALHTGSWRADKLFLRQSPGSAEAGEFHCAPRRQFFFTLSGHCDVETSDGCVVEVGPGGVVLVEDLTGRGHRTRPREGEIITVAVVTLREGEEPEG